MEILLGIIAFVFGTVIFSFLNVVIYRLPRKMDFVMGRSKCPSCGHVLSFADMVPVLSWVFLLGRCRYCKKKISFRYSVVEALGGVLALLNYIVMGVNFNSVLSFVVCCICVCVAFIDADTMEIPDAFCVILAAIGLLATITDGPSHILSHLLGIVVISLPMLVIALMVSGGFGGGDIKLMAAAGFYLGMSNVIFAFFVAVLIGGGFAVYFLITGKKGKKEAFPFGPSLSAGIMAAVFFGGFIVDFYVKQVLMF